MTSMNGTIKRLVSDKGFGFILASDGNEYFFHNSACADTRFDDLREGQSVTFERDRARRVREPSGSRSPRPEPWQRGRAAWQTAVDCAVHRSPWVFALT